MTVVNTSNQDGFLKVRGVHKSFFGQQVLKGVDLTVTAGGVLGLVGENGAGKSTLMNIVGGALRPDEGSMELAGQPYRPQRPQDATARGVSFIHQELNLFPDLTVAENLFIPRFPRQNRWTPFIGRSRMRKEARQVLLRVGLEVDPDLRMERLTAGECQLVEIAKALRQQSRVIIYDEPTTSLSETEIQRLFDIVHQLQDQGLAQIFISHNLDQIRQHCDRILILRDGAVVGEGPTDSFSAGGLVTRMVGRALDHLFPPRSGEPDREVTLSVRGLSQPHVLEDISFAARRGEILGVAGLMGSGRTELMRCIFGLDSFASGEIRLHDRDVSKMTPRQRVKAGMAMLTEDRRTEGLALSGSVFANAGAVVLPRFSRRGSGWVDDRRLREAVRDVSRQVGLKADLEAGSAVRTLSGGNQQKVVLMKWLLNQPELLIVDEPTRGVDVGAKYEIYKLIDALASAGKTVLWVSSETEELIGMCDRIMVMGNGELRATFERGEFDQERMLKAALGGEVTS